MAKVAKHMSCLQQSHLHSRRLQVIGAPEQLESLRVSRQARLYYKSEAKQAEDLCAKTQRWENVIVSSIGVAKKVSLS